MDAVTDPELPQAIPGLFSAAEKSDRVKETRAAFPATLPLLGPHSSDEPMSGTYTEVSATETVPGGLMSSGSAQNQCCKMLLNSHDSRLSRSVIIPSFSSEVQQDCVSPSIAARNLTSTLLLLG